MSKTKDCLSFGTLKEPKTSFTVLMATNGHHTDYGFIKGTSGLIKNNILIYLEAYGYCLLRKFLNISHLKIALMNMGQRD